MKIGVLTHSNANNFGANLQALSTACYLRNNGFTPVFFVWSSYLKSSSNGMNREQVQLHRSFLQRNGFIVTDPVNNDEDFIEYIKSESIKNIIVGSDAVFTVDSFVEKYGLTKKGIIKYKTGEDKKFPNPFWVPFAKSIPECHFFYMSPSCQSTRYRLLSNKTISEMRELMAAYSYLSARDTCTADMIKYITGKAVTITPDPVWGFNENVNLLPSRKEILEKFHLPEKYILMSFYEGTSITQDWIETFRVLAESAGYATFSLPMPQGHFKSNLPKIPLPLDSLDWFAIIKYSCGYIGNNMHPIIVSIHNEVPFYSFDQHGKKLQFLLQFHFEKTSKVYDLLNRFNMLCYRCSLNKWKKILPNEVLNKILSFPIDKEHEIREEMKSQYFEMMGIIKKQFIR